jgi:hypothetical protein
MIKNTILAIFFIPSFMFASFDIEDYKYNKEITSQSSQKGNFFVKVDKDIYKNGNNFFSDLRVVKNEKTEIPYKIKQKKDRLEYSTFFEKIKIVSHNKNTYILDVNNDNEHIDSITVDSKSVEFSRVADIYGSNLEKTRYELLTPKKGSLIFSGPNGFDKILKFKYNKYRFIKVVFSGDEGEFSTNGFSIKKRKKIDIKGEKEEKNVSFKELDTDADNKQRFLLEIENENMPIDYFTFTSKIEEFSREVKLFSSNIKNASFLKNNKRYDKDKVY